MSPSPDVVFSLTGDVRRNSRALRQLRVLASLGHTVEVLTFGPPAPSVLEEGIRLRVLPQPSGSGPLFFARGHRLFRRTALDTPARVYHASDLYTLPALYAAAHRHGGQLVYDARELYPHVASTAGRPWITRFWRWVEGHFIHHVDAAFTVSQRIADEIAATYGIPEPTVLYNVPPFQEVTPSDALRNKLRLDSETVLILHQGQMRDDRGCTLLVDAMQEVEGAVLVFLGGGPLKPQLQQHVSQLHLGRRIHFVDPVPPDELLPLTASADIGVTLLEDTCLNHRFALPNKLFEYLMAGLPVLASDLPEIRNVVKSYDVGYTVNPADRASLVAALRRMVDDADARARWSAHTSRVFETYSWERASRHFTRIYQNLLTSSAPS